MGNLRYRHTAQDFNLINAGKQTVAFYRSAAQPVMAELGRSPRRHDTVLSALQPDLD